MKRLKCVFSADAAFTEGRVYLADDNKSKVVGNDGDLDVPWVLTGMEVKIHVGVLARFEEVA